MKMTRKAYDKLLKSGRLNEIHPEFTGNYAVDIEGKFEKHLTEVTKEVSIWPDWEQGLLGADTIEARKAERDGLNSEKIKEVEYKRKYEVEEFVRIPNENKIVPIFRIVIADPKDKANGYSHTLTMYWGGTAYEASIIKHYKSKVVAKKELDLAIKNYQKEIRGDNSRVEKNICLGTLRHVAPKQKLWREK